MFIYNVYFLIILFSFFKAKNINENDFCVKVDFFKVRVIFRALFSPYLSQIIIAEN